MYDYIIIGAGVIGSMIARKLSMYQGRVLLLEKENDVSCGASKANSGIVHGGYDAKVGTLKAELSRKGNLMYAQLNQELNFGYEMCGSLVVAFEDEELDILEELKINGQLNGVNDLEILDRDQVLEIEPHVNREVVGALYCPSAGITSPYEFTIALAENAVANGVELKLNAEVIKIKKESHFIVDTLDGSYEGKILINAAGGYSDHVAELIGANDFKINPRRGEYVLLNKNQGHLAKHVIFQCPTKEGKGILVTKTFHGNLMLGPNAQEAGSPGDVSTNIEVLNHIVETARKSIPDFDIKKTLTSFSGIRATSNRHDFIIEESPIKGFINVAGIESPGLTSAPAIADLVVEIIEEMGSSLILNPTYDPYRDPLIKIKTDAFNGRVDSTIKEEHIICRCEQVTEAEIVDAMKRGIPINSTDSIKRRVRAGMGLCQGAYCGPKVAEIIARECNIPIEEVQKRGKGSSILPHRESRWFFKESEKSEEELKDGDNEDK